MSRRGNLQATFLAVIVAMTVDSAVWAQERAARLTFEVISIKPAAPLQPGVNAGIKAMPGGQEYQARGISVMQMISPIYKIPMPQITGGPDWLSSERWHIDAKADHGGYSLEDLHLMYQDILTDKFKLRFHRETREGSVFALVVEKTGTKMKLNDSPQDFRVPINGGPGRVVGTRVSMEYLTWWLTQVKPQDGRAVIDRTGLKGNYDFTLSFGPNLPPDFPRDKVPPELLDLPNIFQALKEQLGLRLDATRGPVEYFVIDGAEKPATN